MGRRKIEIKAIKDDRNRSVTFLKRKGGLFKKAHELSVLCSVDVAVIIFGNNKKLYEYSSGDIGEILTRYQYYGGANEHKGPGDFTGKGKGGDDDDDDDDDGSPPSHHGSVEPQMMPPQFPHQQAFQHIRHHTPSASPPIPNGVFPHHPQQRQHTPQPGMNSRPSSRNAIRRPSSNLVPQHPHGPQPPNGHQYAFAPNPPPYNPQMTPGLPPHPHGIPQHMQGPPQGIPHPHQSPGPQYANFGPPQHPQHPQQHPQGPHPHPQQHPHQHPQQLPQHPQQHPQQHAQQHPQQHPHPQVQQIFAEEQRRASMPPAFPPQERPSSRATPSPPQPQQQQISQPAPPQQQQQPQPQQQQQSSPEQQPAQPPQMLEPVKRMSIKSRSIFTPIDESRSILSQHWARSTADSDALKQEPGVRSQSVDVTVNRVKPPSPLQRSQTHNKNRNISLSSVDSFTPPSRTNSAQLSAGGGKRPVLKVQIPEGSSDNGGSATAEDNSSPRSANATANARRNGGDHAGMVLPPPSPSASALLSAGASGPPNPFARPHPVTQPSQGSNASGSNNNSNNNNMIDTPVSALPSRFMNTDFLPSPSSFYPEWNYRGSDSNTLPSPLNFATPVVGTGPSFLDNSDRGGKRKSPEQDTDRDGSDSKRPKLDG